MILTNTRRAVLQVVARELLAGTAHTTALRSQFMSVENKMFGCFELKMKRLTSCVSVFRGLSTPAATQGQLIEGLVASNVVRPTVDRQNSLTLRGERDVLRD